MNTIQNDQKEDVYYSRVDGKWSVADRQDPVVYAKRNGVLSEVELELFEKNGFVQLHGFVPPDQLDELKQASQELASKVELEDDRVVKEPGSKVVRSVFEIHKIHPTFDKMSAIHPIVSVAKQILDSEVYVHQSRINFKPGFTGKPFFWHSDFETWHMEDGMPRMRALSCVVNLSENFEQNGPLMIIPGSHKKYIRCSGETPEDHYKHSLRKQEYGVPSQDALEMLVEEGGIKSMKGSAGSVVFFDCNAMHGSFSNMTPYPRHNLFFVFNSVLNRLQSPFSGQKPRPEFIASRGKTD